MEIIDNIELERVLLKKSVNQYTLDGYGLDDLNSALFDNILLGKNNSFSQIPYLFTKVLWILSKLISKRIVLNKKIILIPAESNKSRSIGLYEPVIKELDGSSFQLISLYKFLSNINIKIFFIWCLAIPELYRKCNECLKLINEDNLNKYRKQIIIDSLVSILLVRQFEYLLKLSPSKKVVVDWDRHKFQSLVVVAAKKLNIKTYTFVHGAIYSTTKFVPLKADFVFTWGDQHNNFFSSLQENQGKFKKVGNPRFRDSLFDKQTILKINKISTSKKIILHPSQNFPDLDEFDVIEKLSKKISESEHFILAVKFHPSQDVVGLTSKIQTLNNTIILKNSMSVLDCLSIADFTLLVSSTFAIDSLIAGIPVVVYTPHSKIKGVAKELVKQAGCLEFTNDTLHRLPILLKDNNYKEKLNLESQLKFKKDYCEFYNVESGHLISDILQNEID